MRATHRRRRMLIGGACLMLALTAAGCFDEDPMPAPSDPSVASTPTGNAFIWALVLEASGACIRGGTIDVLSGPGAGRTFPQDSNCDAWAYSGGVLFLHLAAGTTMTLRASAPGYNSMEKTAVAVLSGGAVEFVLTPVAPAGSR